MRRLAMMLAPMALFALPACQKATPAAVAVDDAWVRLSPVAGRPAAAYFTVRGGGTAERLVAVESAKVEKVELHESGNTDGVMTMRPIDGVEVPAGGEAKFAPGGNHAMLFGVAADIQPGTPLPLTLRFASGLTVATQARTELAGAAPAGHEAH